MTYSEILNTALTALIAFSGFIAAYIFRKQQTVMQGQLAEMKTASRIAEEAFIATQRPWVSVKVAIGPRGLFYDADGCAHLELSFLLKNTGATPAVAVRIAGGPRIDVNRGDRTAELAAVCAKAREQRRNPKMPLAYTVFPNEPLTVTFLYSFADRELLNRNELHGFLFPVVLGCVDYSTTFGGSTHHQSRLDYDLEYVSPDGGRAGFKVSDGDKSADSLRLSPWIEDGSFQAD